MGAQQAAKARDELLANQRNINIQQVGPKLSYRWDTDWIGPGCAASSRGVQHLRKSIEGRDAQLNIGPPPLDWRTIVKLGLQRGQPAEPAHLHLMVPGDEREVYMGLMWPALST